MVAAAARLGACFGGPAAVSPSPAGPFFSGRWKEEKGESRRGGEGARGGGRGKGEGMHEGGGEQPQSQTARGHERKSRKSRKGPPPPPRRAHPAGAGGAGVRHAGVSLLPGGGGRHGAGRVVRPRARGFAVSRGRRARRAAGSVRNTRRHARRGAAGAPCASAGSCRSRRRRCPPRPASASSTPSPARTPRRPQDAAGVHALLRSRAGAVHAGAAGAAPDGVCGAPRH